ncbi:GspH/FimT family pseudopilin [Bacillus sp. NP157]|nr:GspH/FimT family pseudopilin [Bacillus sp. NP157]
MMRRDARGFSLIELMVTITILFILVTFGIPSFRDFLNNSRIRSAAESIQNGLREARNEAAQRGTNVRFELTSGTGASWQVCQLKTTETTCATPTNIFDKRDATETNITVSASTASAKQASGQLGTALTGGVPAGVTYTALGRPSSFNANSIARVDVYGTTTAGRRQVVLVSAGGMTRMCDPVSNTILASTDAQSCGSN